MDNNINQNFGGEAVLSVTLNSDDIQISNYGANSFQVTNTGNKKIAKVVLDVTNALYPDSVFDPFGKAGDTVSKALTINTDGGTGIVAPSNASYIGAGGKKGYEAIELVFNENQNGGFQPGETIGFSIDMDANSVAGTDKSQLDGGSSPKWDVGGVSGAELIGSTFTVTFTDGTKAEGQLQGAKNQAGAQALADQDSPNFPVSLSVNGLDEGDIGTYDADDPKVIIQGAGGKTARVVLTKGFIQPINPYAQFLQDQLNVLSNSDFPANNAVEFQTVDIELTGGNQDITNLFNFSEVADYDFAGEDKLPLGFVASIIDTQNKNLPIGSVTKPIYLEYQEVASNSNSEVAPIITSATSVTIPENQRRVLNINSTDANGDQDRDGLKYSLTGGTDQEVFKINPNNGVLKFVSPPDFENPQDAGINNVYEVEVTVTDSTNRSDRQLFSITVDNLNETAITTDSDRSSSLRLEAEDADTLLNYRQENIAAASGDKVLSLIGRGKNESGSVTFDFKGESNAYDLIVGTFDESDGHASLVVELNDGETGSVTEIASLELDRNLDSNLANSQSFIAPTVALGVDLTPGDTITVHGFENGSEHARLDYIELIPSD